MKKNSKITKGRCFLCKEHSSIEIMIDMKIFCLCKNCDSNFFYGLSPDEKKDRLEYAINISNENKINYGLALNVAMGKYILAEALKRQKLKNRERSGKSVDIFDVGRRRPGGYK